MPFLSRRCLTFRSALWRANVAQNPALFCTLARKRGAKLGTFARTWPRPASKRRAISGKGLSHEAASLDSTMITKIVGFCVKTSVCGGSGPSGKPKGPSSRSENTVKKQCFRVGPSANTGQKRSHEAREHFLQTKYLFCINLKHSQKHGPPGHRNREEHVHPLPRCPGAHFGATVYQRIACQRIPSTVRNTINAHKYAEMRELSALLRELGPGQHPNFVPFRARGCPTKRLPWIPQ